jgi:hypothetical protein
MGSIVVPDDCDNVLCCTEGLLRHFLSVELVGVATGKAIGIPRWDIVQIEFPGLL